MKLMVLDGNSIINRAFYGVKPLSTREGVPTNALYGFINILIKLIDEEHPDGICVAFDRPEPTFRHLRFEGYKAQRKGMPEDLAVQIPLLKEILDTLRIKCYELAGYEADDIIGTIAKHCDLQNHECVIVTGDRDSLQLITDNSRVKLVTTRGGQSSSTNYTVEKFVDDYGFEPSYMTDFKALMGDSSDNIPGVSGIGEKTAKELIMGFGGLSKIYGELDNVDIKESVRRKLAAGKESAEMSFELAKINRDVPIEVIPEEILRKEPDSDKLYDLFLKLEFSKLIDKFKLKKETDSVKEINIHVIESEKELEALIEKCRHSEHIAFMFSKNLDAVMLNVDSEIFGVIENDFDAKSYNNFLKQFFGSGIKKIGYDIKTVMHTLITENIEYDDFVFDIMLGTYLLNAGEGGSDIGKAAVKYISRELPPAIFNDDMAFSPLGQREEAVKNLAEYTTAVHDIWKVQRDEIELQGMNKLMYEIELPLCEVLAESEHIGIKVDSDRLRAFGELLSKGIEEKENIIYEYAGEKFNINSTKVLGNVLFEKLQLPPVKKTKTGYSTNIEVLEKLRDKHPIINEIISYRKLTKLKSTYADGLLKVIDDDGRIRTNFNMTATATGRLSSTEPNLQNIPVREELGSEIRKMFVAKDGCVLVDADYSQIELRVLAHIADDKVMQDAFMTQQDIHRVTASQVFNVSPDEVTGMMRSRAKAVNFGIVYGISDFSLSQDIGVSVYEAREYMENYLDKYSGVRNYMKDVVTKAKETGYVKTLFGRKRNIPELKVSNFNVRSFGERAAMNTPIQGTAADIIKLAMVKVYNRLKQENMETKILLQIHDELILEAPEHEAERAAAILKEEMELDVLNIPLTVDVHTGKDWFSVK